MPGDQDVVGRLVRWSHSTGRGAWQRVSAAVVTAALLAGCGARVAPYLGSGVAAGAGGSRGTGGGTSPSASGSTASTLAGGTAGGGAPTASTPGAVSSSGNGAPSSGSGPAAAASFNLDPASEAAACRGTAGNTASAPGVTASSITVGNVSGLTGVLSNTFAQGPDSVQALFKAINAAGGICGRKLQLDVEDDGQDSSHHAADVSDLIPKVLAFVGSTSDADNGGVTQMQQAGVPDLGFAISPNRSESPDYWSSSGSSEYLVNGRPYGWDTQFLGLAAEHQAPKHLAILSYNVPASAYGAQIFSYGMSHYAGSSICYTDESISPATASLDQDVLEMKAKGCDGVYTTMDTTGNAKLLKAMQEQDFHPGFVGSTGAAYSQDLINVAGSSAAQGFQVYLWFYPFGSSNSMVQQYQSEMATYEPGVELNFFGVLAWGDAQMFVYSLLHAGRNPTRASLSSQLSALTDWTTGGMFSPTTPRLRQTPGHCIVEMVVKGNTFATDFPSSGMYCNGQLVPLG
jgi:branched-chain amino acid transport system substrate-binding protein